MAEQDAQQGWKGIGWLVAKLNKEERMRTATTVAATLFFALLVLLIAALFDPPADPTEPAVEQGKRWAVARDRADKGAAIATRARQALDVENARDAKAERQAAEAAGVYDAPAPNQGDVRPTSDPPR